MMRQHGFTFIELLMVMFIIGVLSSIAIPAYQDYLYRAQVAEALLMSSTLKQACLEYYTHRGVFPADNSVLAYTFNNPVGQYVNAITVDQGNIQFTFGNNSGAALQGQQFSLVPQVLNEQPLLVSWRCDTSDFPQQFLPVNCRG